MCADVTDYSSLPTEGVNEKSEDLDLLDASGIADLMSASLLDVYAAVETAKPQISLAIEAAAESVRAGGRVIYCGCGTSGRLGVLDASECGPTFSADGIFIGVIAGGDRALRQSSESAEDDPEAGAGVIEELSVGKNDTVIAISASGTAKWCLGALGEAKKRGSKTFALTCAKGSPMARAADTAIVTETGPEVLSGSTRLKAGTAAKLVLNMISTGAFALTGRVYKNLMVDVRATNKKLYDRRVRIVMAATGADRAEAERLLIESSGDAKAAIVMKTAGAGAKEAKAALEESSGGARKAIEILRSGKT